MIKHVFGRRNWKCTRCTGRSFTGGGIIAHLHRGHKLNRIQYDTSPTHEAHEIFDKAGKKIAWAISP